MVNLLDSLWLYFEKCPLYNVSKLRKIRETYQDNRSGHKFEPVTFQNTNESADTFGGAVLLDRKNERSLHTCSAHTYLYAITILLEVTHHYTC